MNSGLDLMSSNKLCICPRNKINFLKLFLSVLMFCSSKLCKVLSHHHQYRQYFSSFQAPYKKIFINFHFNLSFFSCCDKNQNLISNFHILEIFFLFFSFPNCLLCLKTFEKFSSTCILQVSCGNKKNNLSAFVSGGVNFHYSHIYLK